MRTGAVAMVCGTRPEIVKLAPLVWELGEAAVTIHTGQHPSGVLAPILDDLDLPAPTAAATIAPRPRGRQIGEAVVAVTAHLEALAPDVVVVQGDTNSTLAGALAATAADLPIVHVESGLRAFDRRMAEERNRVVVDHLADVLCAPTAIARANLRAEGIDPGRIVVTGNTVVDAARQSLPRAEARDLDRFGVTAGDFVLATFHRPENVDDPARLAGIAASLAEMPVPVLLPVHPRTRDRAHRAGIHLGGGAVRAIDPVGYLDFLALERACALIVTDSGGVQEEASIVGRPVVVARRATERPEVLGTFATLVSTDGIPGAVRAVLAELPATHAFLASCPTPYGDGRAAPRTADAIRALVASSTGDATATRPYDALHGRDHGESLDA